MNDEGGNISEKLYKEKKRKVDWEATFIEFQNRKPVLYIITLASLIFFCAVGLTHGIITLYEYNSQVFMYVVYAIIAFFVILGICKYIKNVKECIKYK